MNIGIISSDIFKKHDTSEIKNSGLYTHPESPQRIDSITEYLQDKEAWKIAEKIQTKEITDEYLLKVHTPEYLKSLNDFCQKGGGRINEDTVTSQESPLIAKIAAGSVLQAVDYVMTDKLRKVFCIVRPPGHHAIPNQSMGFCLFSNISLGAVYAMSKYNTQKIMIIDWDAHHGNGTEKIFYDNEKVLTVSLHQYPFWPFTGKFEDFGLDKGYGYNLNIPVPESFTDELYIDSFDKIIAPVAKKFKPELIFLAAGYDAHHSDTLAGLNLTSPIYDYLTKKVVDLSEELCQGKLIACLEGGYNLDALAKGVYSTINLMQFPDYTIKEKWTNEKKDNKETMIKLINYISETHPLLK